MDELIPEDHLLRKIDSVIDFTKIYEIVSDLYCENNGRPSIDPIVLFKMVLIQHIYGIPSLRKTADEIKVNVAYRWFLGYLLNEQTPHFSTISYNFKNRFTAETIEKVFYWILNEIEQAGYLTPETVFVDGTHIKANANMKKAVKKAVPKAAKIYEEKLMEEINEDREEHGKKPFDDTKPPKERIVNESTTDPECGVFHKGEHKKCFAYTAQTACDKKGYILDVTVNPGNVHDSVAFDGLYARLTEHYPEIQNVVADAGYKTPWICKEVIDDGRIPILPYTRPAGVKDYYRPSEYVYDVYYDCVICPENQVLNYSTTNRDGYKEYKSKGYKCEKEIKWRCINRIQYGKKNCHSSPTIDEQALHKAIISAINEFCEVKDEVAKALRESITEVLDPNLNGSIQAAQQRIDELAHNIDELIKLATVPETAATAMADIEKFSEEMKTLREFIETEKAKQIAVQRGSAELDAILKRLEKEDFTMTEYNDVAVRQLIEKVTVESKNVITVAFKGGLEIRKELDIGD